MTFAPYNPTTPVGSVRLLIGDTDPQATADVRLEDEEITRLLELSCGSVTPGVAGLNRVAADAADVLAAKFARKAEGSFGPNRVAPSNRAQELRATAARLRNRAAEGAGIFAGGVSRADKAARAANPDRPEQPFRAGQMDIEPVA